MTHTPASYGICVSNVLLHAVSARQCGASAEHMHSHKVMHSACACKINNLLVSQSLMALSQAGTTRHYETPLQVRSCGLQWLPYAA